MILTTGVVYAGGGGGGSPGGKDCSRLQDKRAQNEGLQGAQ
jgi:hypothetical protein